MKLECKIGNLKNKLSVIEKITGKNLSLPILNSILFEVKNNDLIIKATNLEVGAEMKIPIKGEKDGKTAVVGSVINNTLNTLSDDDVVKITLIGNNLSLVSKKTNTLIKTYPPDDFPTIPKIKNGKIIKIESTIFTNGIRTVSFAAATSDIKPEISSIYIYSENEFLYFVATDSFRLAEKKTKVKNLNLGPVLIPQKNANEIIKFFDNTNEEVELVFDKNQLSLETKDVYITTRLTDGVYPNYRQIIPTTHKTNIVVLKKDIQNSLRLAGVFIDDFNRVTFKIISEDNFVELISQNNNKGENTTKIDAHLEGEDVEIGVNYRYLSEVFGVLGSDSVSIKFNDATKPILITPVGDDLFSYIVMPVSR